MESAKFILAVLTLFSNFKRQFRNVKCMFVAYKWRFKKTMVHFRTEYKLKKVGDNWFKVGECHTLQ